MKRASLIYFTIYGLFLIQIKKLNNLLPTIRNVNCIINNNLYNITIYFYFMKLLQFFPFLIKYFNFKIDKIKFDYYINNNHSVIFVENKSLDEYINISNNFIKECKENILYDKYCFNLSIVKINNESLCLSFIKDLVNKFRGVDSNYHQFFKHSISNKIVDIFQFYNYSINSIEIIKIPPIIKKLYNNIDNLCIYEIF